VPRCAAVLFLLMLLAAAHIQASEKGLTGTPHELKLYRLLAEGNFIEARKSAETLLRSNDDSYAALYAIAVITKRTETNLPKAYYYLEKAKHSFETRYGRIPQDAAPWRWHLRILEELIETSEEMELLEKTIGYLKAHDAAYIPLKTASYAWPLMARHRPCAQGK